ncbi:MAG: ABC transporter permease [Lachnospiraceae bacterium]|jgi:peptide/nickel transport system permease protein|nr:ABC transporter permease [Lachnospiraceae bacterium]
MKHKKKWNRAMITGICIIAFFLAVAVLAPLIAPYDPNEMIRGYLPPSKEHILGTNDVGQDIFSEMIYGTRVSLYIGIFAACIVTGIGTVLALISGYFGGVADKVITAVTNVAMAVPGLPLTVLMVAYLEPGKWSLIISISVTAWTGTMRILRSRVQQLSQMPFIKSERALGVSPAVILYRHILPNVKDIILTRGALTVSSAMMTEAGLSFLGLGSVTEKSWGGVLHYAFFRNSILKNQVWWYLPPILCICVAVLGFMLAGYYGQRKKA